jgi:RNA polymerase sigma-70 factor (ECF subfamily)
MSRLRILVGTKQTQIGDDAGLRSAYSAHGGELYGLALRSLDDPGMAEEAVQETFLRAWRAAGRFDPTLGSLRGWLFAICRNVIIDLARARNVRPPVAGPTDTGAEDDALEACLRSWLVEEALRRVSEQHRTAITETYFKGRSAEEVAASLDVPIGTVRSRLFYGLKALRLTLEEMGWNDD